MVGDARPVMRMLEGVGPELGHPRDAQAVPAQQVM